MCWLCRSSAGCVLHLMGDLCKTHTRTCVKASLNAARASDEQSSLATHSDLGEEQAACNYASSGVHSAATPCVYTRPSLKHLPLQSKLFFHCLHTPHPTPHTARVLVSKPVGAEQWADSMQCLVKQCMMLYGMRIVMKPDNRIERAQFTSSMYAVVAR